MLSIVSSACGRSSSRTCSMSMILRSCFRFFAFSASDCDNFCKVVVRLERDLELLVKFLIDSPEPGQSPLRRRRRVIAVHLPMRMRRAVLYW